MDRIRDDRLIKLINLMLRSAECGLYLLPLQGVVRSGYLLPLQGVLRSGYLLPLQGVVRGGYLLPQGLGVG